MDILIQKKFKEVDKWGWKFEWTRRWKEGSKLMKGYGCIDGHWWLLMNIVQTFRILTILIIILILLFILLKHLNTFQLSSSKIKQEPLNCSWRSSCVLRVLQKIKHTKDHLFVLSTFDLSNSNVLSSLVWLFWLKEQVKWVFLDQIISAIIDKVRIKVKLLTLLVMVGI